MAFTGGLASGACGSVEGIDPSQAFANSSSFAGTAFQAALALFNSLQDPTNSIISGTDLSVDIPNAPVFDGGNFSTPNAPTPPTIEDETFPVIPSAPDVPVITPVVLTDPPILTATEPAIADLTPPGSFTTLPPDAVTLQELTVPVEPDTTLPAVPSLASLTLPVAPAIVIPTFDFVLPDTPEAPENIFSFTEPPYSSELLDNLLTELNGIITSTSALGMAEEVWQQVWDAQRERELNQGNVVIEAAEVEFASRGFGMPPGALAMRVLDARQAVQNKLALVNREQTIERAREELEMVKFGITEGTRLEIQLQTQANQIADRTLEAAKAVLDASLGIFNARVAAYNATVSAYAATATVYRARIEGELAKVELYKAQIEGEIAKGEINKQLVDLYVAQIGAVRASYELYEARLEAAKFPIEEDRLKLDKYRSDITAFVAQADVFTKEFDAYATKVRAEGLKVDVYNSQVNAYNTTINAWAALQSARLENKTNEIAVERFGLDTFIATVEAVKVQTDAIASQIGAETDLYKGQVDGFTAEVNAESARYGADVDKYSADVRAYSSQVTAEIEEARVAVLALQAQLQTISDRVIAGARIAGQIAASALAQINVSSNTSLSSSSNCTTSTTEGFSEQVLTQIIHNCECN